MNKVPNLKKEPLIFISAADISAERHAAKLVEAVRKLRPGAKFVGVGGTNLAEQGVEMLADVMDQSAMTYQAIAKIGYFLRIIHNVGQLFKQRDFDAVVFVDSPALHFPMARKAKAQGIPSLYYIAPQVWAWRRGRRKKLRRLIDKIACVLPFEQDLFRSYGIDTTYVGCPLLDNFSSWDNSQPADFQKGQPTLALLPGSRAHEVEALAPAMITIAKRVREQWPKARFIIPAANEKIRGIINDLLGSDKDDFHVACGIIHQAIAASDFCIAASGTVTLEIAAHGCPMVVMYHVNPLIWKLIGWWLVPQRPLCLVNILAGEIIVPEFMPWYGSAEPVAKKVLELLADPQALQRSSSRLLELSEPLKRPGTAESTAQILLELADGRASGRTEDSGRAQLAQ